MTPSSSTQARQQETDHAHPGTRQKCESRVDNGSDPSTASSQARELVLQDHAVALLGFATPLIVMPTALAAEQLRVPFLTSQMPVEEFTSGLDVVGDYTFPVGTTDFSSFTADAKARGAQLLAGQIAPAGGVALWKQLKSSGFRPKAAFLAKASDADSWWQSLGSLAQGTLSESYWSPGQASPGQIATITPTLGKKYAGNPDYAAAAVAYAVAEVLTAGLVKFNQSTHTAITPYYITQWQNGKLVQVQPLAPSVTLGVPTAGLG
jgi:ABC-type branched-subunit amino acid transport system substrate-binding protein